MDPTSQTPSESSTEPHARSQGSAPGVAHVPSATPPLSAVAQSDGSESSDIEPEWLDRTHHVMQSFATDPYQLMKEFAALRADYVKHRYHKVIKTSGGQKDGK